MKNRVKLHHFPGDLAKSEKIALLEGRLSDQEELSHAKSYRKLIKERSHSAKRTHSTRVIQDQLSE